MQAFEGIEAKWEPLDKKGRTDQGSLTEMPQDCLTVEERVGYALGPVRESQIVNPRWWRGG